MNCSESQPLLDLLCDGALEHRDSALLLDHIKTCTVCELQWLSHENLHTIFRSERNKVIAPPNLTDRISARLKQEKGEERALLFSRYRRLFAFSSVMVAAAVLLLIITPLKGNVDLISAGASYSTQSLISDLIADSGVETVNSKHELAQQLGYELKYLHLPKWKMSKLGLYRAKLAPTALARFDFEKPGASGFQHLTCYQGPKGIIKTMDGQSEDLAGRKVTFGHSGQYQFALWSVDNRDYLFISDMSNADLRELVRSS